MSVLDKSDIKYSTFNRYITHMHTFLQFLKMKNIEVLKFYPERFLKKGFSEHNERSVPEKTIAHLIKELPAFPEHLQLMYLILYTELVCSRLLNILSLHRYPRHHRLRL